MNTLFQKIAAGLTLAFCLSLTSCEKENLFTPNPTGSARSIAPDDSTIVGSSLVHKLTRYGDAKLTYGDNGQLLTVTTALRGALTIQTDYTYSPGKIRAFTHQGREVLHDETFTLDANGRCTESNEKGLDGNKDLHWVYAYTEKGQLEYCIESFGWATGTSYTYNADGDMVKARIRYSAYDGVWATFAYDKPTGAPLLTDKHPLNNSFPKIPMHDTYLRIFGKPSKHLVKQVSYESMLPIPNSPVPGNLSYTYTLDQDGYVTKRVEENAQSGVLPKTTLYEYVIPYLAKQL